MTLGRGRVCWPYAWVILPTCFNWPGVCIFLFLSLEHRAAYLFYLATKSCWINITKQPSAKVTMKAFHLRFLPSLNCPQTFSCTIFSWIPVVQVTGKEEKWLTGFCCMLLHVIFSLDFPEAISHAKKKILATTTTPKTTETGRCEQVRSTVSIPSFFSTTLTTGLSRQMQSFYLAALTWTAVFPFKQSAEVSM